MALHSDFDDAWDEFATGDAKVDVPPRLREAVMTAWDTSRETRVRPPVRRRHLLPAMAAIVAAIAIAAAALLVRRNQANIVETPAPLLVLMADPLFDEEPLQLVHLRLSRTSLEALGITPSEPEASSLIDVEVVVGSDGLPRAVRALRPVLEIGGL